MQRREFCKVIAGAAAATAVPALAQTNNAAQSPVFKSFNTYSQDYAKFCATPAGERVFYALENGQVVTKKLDEKTWTVCKEDELTKLPIPGGSWDSVPVNSPIPNLSGSGPYKPTWESLLQYEAPEWYQDAKFGIWAHWSPQCVAEAGDWYARSMYMERIDDYKYQLKHYGHPSKFGYKDLCAQWTLLNWDPEALIARYKKAGARIFVALANHHDGFDPGPPSISPGMPRASARIAMSSAGGPKRRATRGCASASRFTRRATGGGSRPRTARTRRARWRACLTTAT